MANAARFFHEGQDRMASMVPEPLSDEELVRRAQEANDVQAMEYLLRKYRPLVRAKIKPYFLVGAERDDLLQIGMIGLWEAIIDYRANHHTSFACFAKVCIQRQVISAIKAATRQKQSPLNSSLPLDAPVSGDDDDRALSEVVANNAEADPETIVLGEEGERQLEERLRQELSPFEWRVLQEYRTGKSYREMAMRLDCKVKSIDNALSRIRRKLPLVAPEQVRRLRPRRS